MDNDILIFFYSFLITILITLKLLYYTIKKIKIDN